jgi:hypothetical protein
MYRAIARLIILPLLYVKDLLIVMREYAAYIGCLLVLALLLSVPIVFIVMGGYAAYVGYLFALILLSIGGLVVYAIYFIDWRDPPLTYQQLRITCHPGDEMTAHFPLEIPNEARDVDMHYSVEPSGCFTWQVRMKLPPTQIREIKDRFRPAAKLKYVPGRDDNSINEEYNLDYRLRFSNYVLYWDEIKDRSFQEHYEILVLEDTSGMGNYKSCNYGVAIDFSASEVFYWTTQIS